MSYIPDLPGVYQGKQVIINSDRLVFNAKEESIFLYSNEAIGFSTNGSFHFDTGILDENKFIVNAPNIYLGLNYEGDLPHSPAVKGYELGEYLGSDDGVLSLLEDMIDIITGQLTFISPFPDPLTGRTKKTAPNYSKNYSKFSNVLNRIHTLQRSIGDFKSQITKIA
jgi:hypothetical protein